MRLTRALPAVLVLVVSRAVAQPPPPDKSAYSLLHPTPPELRRPLDVAGADFTIDPYTVDAGVLQLQMTPVLYAQDAVTTAGVSRDGWEFATTLLRIGMFNDFEIGVILQPYTIGHLQRNTLVSTTDVGFGDVTLRAKLNIWGNDGGATALGILPYITFPTGTGVSARGVEAGITVPFAWNLTGAVSIETNLEVDVLHSAAEGYYVQLPLSAELDIALHDNLTWYAEFVGITLFDGSGFQPYLGTGLELALTDNLGVGAGVTFGLSAPAVEIVTALLVTVRY